MYVGMLYQFRNNVVIAVGCNCFRFILAFLFLVIRSIHIVPICSLLS